MSLRFAYRPYRLPLRQAVRTAHETWTEREGILLRLESEAGAVGFGEIAPIPAFGTETVLEAEEICRTLGNHATDEQIAGIGRRYGCVRNALIEARRSLELESATGEPDGVKSPTTTDYRPIAALLPAGRAGVAQAIAKAESGFRVFKWKVGVGDIGDELVCLDDLCGVLPAGSKLRLDANGAWDRRRAERWLERCADRPVEFVEQPCFAPRSAGDAAAKRAEDLLHGLAEEYPTPIALDESVVSDGDVDRWIEAQWPGWFVLKPCLLGDIDRVLARLQTARATVVFSSSLETAVGAASALRAAFRWPGEAKALGFGVWPLFMDSRFDGPAAGPFLRREDVVRAKPEELWNALT